MRIKILQEQPESTSVLSLAHAIKLSRVSPHSTSVPSNFSWLVWCQNCEMLCSFNKKCDDFNALCSDQSMLNFLPISHIWNLKFDFCLNYFLYYFDVFLIWVFNAGCLDAGCHQKMQKHFSILTTISHSVEQGIPLMHNSTLLMH